MRNANGSADSYKGLSGTIDHHIYLLPTPATHYFLMVALPRTALLQTKHL